MSARILIVEDEPGVVLVVSDLLRSNGYAVGTAHDGNTGLRRASEHEFDLIILDLMLPDISGLEVCNTVREQGFAGGILMLTAKGQAPDRVQGLRMGADDYLVKPFDNEELLARVAALLRRVNRKDLTPVLRIEFGNVIADFTQREFSKAGKAVVLTPKETELLRFLITQRGQVLTREKILGQVWKEQPFITTRTVDVHIGWLRQKLEDKPDAPKHILTVRGEGYCFDK